MTSRRDADAQDLATIALLGARVAALTHAARELTTAAELLERHTTAARSSGAGEASAELRDPATRLPGDGSRRFAVATRTTSAPAKQLRPGQAAQPAKRRTARPAKQWPAPEDLAAANAELQCAARSVR